jgi:hypothetical protein
MTQLYDLNQDTIYPVTFVKIEFPNGTLRLNTGASPETLFGEVYEAESEDWGAVLQSEPVERAIGAVETGFRKVFTAGPLLLAAARNPASSGSRFTVWTANVGHAEGPSSIALDHFGNVNKMPVTHGFPAVVVIEAANPLDEASKVLTQYSLSPQGQKLIDPADKFCEFMSTSDLTLPWGGRNSPPFAMGRAGSSVNLATEARTVAAAVRNRLR